MTGWGSSTGDLNLSRDLGYGQVLMFIAKCLVLLLLHSKDVTRELQGTRTAGTKILGDGRLQHLL